MPLPRTFAFVLVLALLVCGSVTASVALAADPPLADTGAAQDVGQTQATLVATVTPRGSATTVRFDLGTAAPAYGLQSTSKDVGAGTDPVRVEIPVQGLTQNTTYHFRVVATSAGGTVNGADATFRTSATVTAPSVATGGAADVGLDAATLTASVNPRGATTSYKFEWGTSSRLGTSTASGSLAASTRSSTVRTRIGGLSAGKKYYYRVVATNASGTSRGATRTFSAASTATSATLVASGDRVTYGKGVTLSGRLGGSKVSGVAVKLQTTTFPFSAPFADSGAAIKSNSKGEYAFSLPAVTTTLRALVVVDGLPPFFSAPVTIRSAARTGITSITRRANGQVVVRGRMVPATAKGVVALQRQAADGARWLPLKRARVRAGGAYAITLRARKAAMAIRAVGLPHDGGAHVSGASRTVKIAARHRR